MLVDQYQVLPPLIILLKNQIDLYFRPVPLPSTTASAVGSDGDVSMVAGSNGESKESRRSDKGEIIQLLYGVVNLLRHLAIPR